MEFPYRRYDKVHGIMETAGSPVILLGDMNAQLPGQQNLAVKWYRDRKFNNHSLFLHDFLSDHCLVSANFAFKQNVNYTYFSGSLSHILITYFSQKIFSAISRRVQYYLIIQTMLVIIFH